MAHQTLDLQQQMTELMPKPMVVMVVTMPMLMELVELMAPVALVLPVVASVALHKVVLLVV
jgi:hypothetical protein